MADLPDNVRRAIEAAEAWSRATPTDEDEVVLRACGSSRASYGYACGILARDAEVEELKRERDELRAEAARLRAWIQLEIINAASKHEPPDTSEHSYGNYDDCYSDGLARGVWELAQEARKALEELTR